MVFCGRFLNPHAVVYRNLLVRFLHFKKGVEGYGIKKEDQRGG